MPRTGLKPWFRAGRGWYVTMDGRQVPLNVRDHDKLDAALAAVDALRAQLARPDTPGRAPPNWPARVREYFVAREKKGVSAVTLAKYRRDLNHWLDKFGDTPAADLTGDAIEDHALTFPWRPNQRRNYLAAVVTFLRWAGCPVRIHLPTRESVGAESVIPEAVHVRAVAAAVGDLRPLLGFLWHTGCRPAEGHGLTAEAIDWQSGTARLKEHKMRHRGRDRILYLSSAALLILRGQFDRYGAGLLFRNKLGRRFGDKALAKQMGRISERIGHRVTAYCYRHTYASRALALGLPDTHVAALLGHQSTKMIHKHYSHLSAFAGVMKDAAEKLAA